MGDEGNTPPGRRPPPERRTRLGRRKQPVIGRKAKPAPKRPPSGDATSETKRPPSREATPAEKSAARRAAAPPAAESRGEVISRRISAVVILLAIAIAIMALTDAAPFFDDVTEEQRAEDAVERFFAAYGERDFETVCSLFSPQVVQGIEQAGATETREKEIGGCPEVLEARFGAADGEETELDVKIESVRVSGPRAVADVIVKTEEAPKGRPLPVELERGPDGWLITRQVITG